MKNLKKELAETKLKKRLMEIEDKLGTVRAERDYRNQFKGIDLTEDEKALIDEAVEINKKLSQ